MERERTASPAPAPVLDVREVSRRFRVGPAWRATDRLAVEDVSFSLRRGEVVALVGESGSGKSTVTRILARLLAPTSGQVVFDGRDAHRDGSRGASREYRRRVQLIFQDPFASLNPVHTVAHHLERPLRIHGLARGADDLRRRVEALLRGVGLEPAADFAAKRPHQLSGGQRQRVAIARALASEPEVLLADEPVSMLDVSVRLGILNLFATLRDERGIAILYVTHDLASARYLADRILVLYAGRLVEAGPSEEVIHGPAHPYTRLLLSSVPDPGRAGSREAAGWRGGAAGGAGCPFAWACPEAMEVCRERMPEAFSVGEGRSARCHLHAPAGPEGRRER